MVSDDGPGLYKRIDKGNKKPYFLHGKGEIVITNGKPYICDLFVRNMEDVLSVY